MRDWLKHKLDIELRPFEQLRPSDIGTAHDPSYVNAVISGARENGFGNNDPATTDSMLFTTSSMVSAARHVAIARKKGEVTAACSPTSGFHHAGYTFGGGFCTFNGLMIAAVSLLTSKLSKRVGILDYDYHYGNGTDSIIEMLRLRNKVTHISSGYFYTQPSQAAKFLVSITQSIDAMRSAGCDILLYQAGADQHIDDPLGGMLTNDQLLQRDMTVFMYCKRVGLPVAWNLAGGYQQSPGGSIAKVLTIHRNTMKACIASFGETQ
jgi:acetoin utilization deacetylase AcuC-like enzyme